MKPRVKILLWLLLITTIAMCPLNLAKADLEGISDWFYNWVKKHTNPCMATDNQGNIGVAWSEYKGVSPLGSKKDLTLYFSKIDPTGNILIDKTEILELTGVGGGFREIIFDKNDNAWLLWNWGGIEIEVKYLSFVRISSNGVVGTIQKTDIPFQTGGRAYYDEESDNIILLSQRNFGFSDYYIRISTVSGIVEEKMKAPYSIKRKDYFNFGSFRHFDFVPLPDKKIFILGTHNREFYRPETGVGYFNGYVACVIDLEKKTYLHYYQIESFDERNTLKNSLNLEEVSFRKIKNLSFPVGERWYMWKCRAQLMRPQSGEIIATVSDKDRDGTPTVFQIRFDDEGELMMPEKGKVEVLKGPKLLEKKSPIGRIKFAFGYGFKDKVTKNIVRTETIYQYGFDKEGRIYLRKYKVDYPD